MKSWWPNPFLLLLQWAAALENIDHGTPGSDKSFGMKQRPDGDIEIDEKFWEEDFTIPTCQKCGGVLKPDVSNLWRVNLTPPSSPLFISGMFTVLRS